MILINFREDNIILAPRDLDLFITGRKKIDEVSLLFESFQQF